MPISKTLVICGFVLILSAGVILSGTNAIWDRAKFASSGFSADEEAKEAVSEDCDIAGE